MYMNGTHQDTCEIHARYMRDTWDTYPDNKPPPNSITNPTSPKYVDLPRWFYVAWSVSRICPLRKTASNRVDDVAYAVPVVASAAAA